MENFIFLSAIFMKGIFLLLIGTMVPLFSARVCAVFVILLTENHSYRRSYAIIMNVFMIISVSLIFPILKSIYDSPHTTKFTEFLSPASFIDFPLGIVITITGSLLSIALANKIKFSGIGCL